MEYRPLKETLDALADAWGVPRSIMHRTTLRAVGPRTYRNARGKYVALNIAPTDATKLNLSLETVILRSATDKKSWLCAIQPSSYKDKDDQERPAASAYSREYLEDVAMITIPFSDFVPDPESPDGRRLSEAKKRATRPPAARKKRKRGDA